VLALCLLALLPAGAYAVGQIGFGGCVGNDGAQGCLDLPAAPITGASSLAVSPNSASVYVTAQDADSLSHFFAAPQGQITFGGCVANTGAQNCTVVPDAPLDLPGDVVVRSTGGVYVPSINRGSISHFFAAPQGQVVFGGCLANVGAPGCGDLPEFPLSSTNSVAVSPNGGALWASGFGASSITHFYVAPGGQLTYDGCLASTGANNCGDLPGAPLDGASGVAVSPDGGSIYVVSNSSNTISHFFVAPQGQITFGGCLGSDTAGGACGDLPFAPLNGARNVAVSPDGRSVYVASQSSNTVAHFFRAPAGQLTYDGCLGNDAAQGCGDLPGEPLTGARDVAVSLDNGSVYVASITANSVAHFFRAPAGQIAYDGCLANAASQNCGDLPSAPLSGASSVAVSPDGDSVYVASLTASTVSHFYRVQAGGSLPPESGPSTPGNQDRPGPGTPGAQRCQGKRATIVGTARSDRLKGTRKADVIVSLGGNDRIAAGAGNDLICAGRGNDTVDGSSGKDRAYGDSGNDRLSGGTGNDRVIGLSGKDTLRGGTGNDLLDGGSGNDRLSGQSGRDTLLGRSGRDLLNGGPGVDRQKS